MTSLSLSTLSCSANKVKPEKLSIQSSNTSGNLTSEHEIIIQQCDKTLHQCDLTLQKKNQEIKKQEELLQQQAKELADAKVKGDNPLTSPIVWAGVGTAAVGIAGPLAIPFVILGAVLVGVFVK